MIRSVTLCILFTVATLCHGDDRAEEFNNVGDNNFNKGVFADVSPVELQQLSTINETARKVLSKLICKEFDKYEARITQLEDELARRPNPQPRYAPPAPVPQLPSPYQGLQPTPNYNPYAPLPRIAKPKSTPTRTQPKSPQAQQPLTTPLRQAPSAKTWQRFHVNGRWFYIIPVEQVDAFTPSQAQ